MRSCVLLAAVAVACAVAGAPLPGSYVASAVQFSYVYEGGNATAIVERNVRRYGPEVAAAARGGAQLVVLPEGANGWMQLVLDGNYNRTAYAAFAERLPTDWRDVVYRPCGNGSAGGAFAFGPQVVALCRYAVRHGVVVVGNLVGLAPCRADAGPCPADGHFQFNTDVVLDGAAGGALLAVYFKHFLSGSAPALDQPTGVYRDTAVTFMPTFGVEFGIIICQDLAFANATLPYTERGVRNILFSTHWGNLDPVVTALPLQQAYSALYGVNLVASNNANSPSCVGGGLFSNGRAVATFFRPDPVNATAVVTGTLPSVPLPRPTPEAPAFVVPGPGSAAGCRIGRFGIPGTCAPFTVGNAGGGPPRGKLVLANVSFGNVSCAVRMDIERSAATTASTWAVYVTSFPFVDPHSPSNLGFQLCGVAPCAPASSSGGGLTCGVPLAAGGVAPVIASMHIQAYGLRSTAVVSPLLTVGGGFVLPDGIANATFPAPRRNYPAHGPATDDASGALYVAGPAGPLHAATVAGVYPLERGPRPLRPVNPPKARSVSVTLQGDEPPRVFPARWFDLPDHCLSTQQL